MLKTVRYETPRIHHTCAVAYYMFDGHICVFTAVDPATMGSTINNAEGIALAISEKEDVNVWSLRFFDLQTRTSYTGGPNMSKPGDFEFEELILEAATSRCEGFQVSRWQLTKCPQYVLKMFWAFIDGEPRQRSVHPITVEI